MFSLQYYDNDLKKEKFLLNLLSPGGDIKKDLKKRDLMCEDIDDDGILRDKGYRKYLIGQSIRYVHCSLQFKIDICQINI